MIKRFSGIALASTLLCLSVTAELRSDDALRILPLGDSITHGGSERPSYRRELWLLLKAHGLNIDFVGSQRDFHGRPPPDKQIDFDLDHEGHWGWEVNQIVEGLPEWLQHYTPDIALIHLGTNDFDRGENSAQTLNELKLVIDILRQDNPAMTILLAEIIPMRFKSTKSFNTNLREWATTMQTAQSRLMLVDQNTGYYSLIDNHDKYHPNARGERKLAKRWFDALISVTSSDK